MPGGDGSCDETTSSFRTARGPRPNSRRDLSQVHTNLVRLPEHDVGIFMAYSSYGDGGDFAEYASTPTRGPSSGAETRGNSALDAALWDLFGKVMGHPLCQLLGGRARSGSAPTTPALATVTSAKRRGRR